MPSPCQVSSLWSSDVDWSEPWLFFFFLLCIMALHHSFPPPGAASTALLLGTIELHLG